MWPLHRKPVMMPVIASICLAALLVAACGDAPKSATAPTATPRHGGCPREATPSTFPSQFSAATAGQTICLASGDYGTFTGARKPGLVTLRAQSAAIASMRVSFDGASNIALDGLRITGGTLLDSTHDITIRNSTFTAPLRIDGLVNANVLLDHNTHNNINACNGCYPARIWLSYPSSRPSGVTVMSSQMVGGNTDGIQAGPAVNVLNNEFGNIVEGSCSACHTDAIQLYSGGGDRVGSVIKGNYIHDSSTGIVQYDGGGYNYIEDNVVWGGRSIILGGDTNSVVRHNTVDGDIDFTSKAGATSRGEVVKDNIAQQVNLSNGVGGDAKPAENTNNMVRAGEIGANFIGTPRFVGGANPPTFRGFQLASGSPGRHAATGGKNVGIF